ncbi:hypothetical protein LSH36_932g01073 [Paralvinella palmiformis]|uniref:C-type lectin domain-containing protein n=1 Tax=Paralvinella palmiformis TaxID=53620 RepID=A0AAD9IXC5_9ANNE|nr:hypothetical protein LSH36_932g01073 [Paralvinella palmiformis]
MRHLLNSNIFLTSALRSVLSKCLRLYGDIDGFVDIMLLTLFFMLGTVLYVGSYQANPRCTGQLCLYTPQTWASWNQSYYTCRQDAMELLTINDNKTKHDVDELIKELPMEENVKIWLAGKGSNDIVKWKYMNNSDIQESLRKRITDTERVQIVYMLCCKRVKIIQYTSDQCDEKNSRSRLICQYAPTTRNGGSCDRDDMLYKDTCYIRTPYVARNQVTGIDWFGGQTYCGSLRSVIMYSHIEDKMFTSQLREWLKPSTKLQLWIGVRKKIWYWQKAGVGSESDQMAISYFNWYSNKGRFPTKDTCIYIARSYDNRWGSTQCTRWLKYFICINTSNPVTTRITAEQETVSLTKLGYTTTGLNHDNAGDTGTKNTDPVRDTVIEETDVSPYAEVCFGKRINNISEKKRARSAAKMHNGYTNGKRKTRDEKASNRCNKQPERDDTETSTEVPDTATSAMTYKQAPSGDLYATVNKDGSEEGNVKHIVTEQGDMYAVSTKKL